MKVREEGRKREHGDEGERGREKGRTKLKKINTTYVNSE